MAYASVGRLNATTPEGRAAIVEYYTRDTRGAAVELSEKDLGLMVSYYQAHGGATWIGQGLESLGLQLGGVVDKESMARLLAGHHPDKTMDLPGRGGGKETISAFDLTIAAPKELSGIIMLAPKKDQANIRAAFEAYCKEAIEWLEEEAAVVRRGAGGHLHQTAEGFVAIQVGHSTARPVDGVTAPHEHAHYVIINRAKGPDGRWTSLDAGRLMKSQKEIGSMVGARMRDFMFREYGISWEQQENSVVYRMAGFDEALREKLSLRHRQLIEKAMEIGADLSDTGTVEGIRRASKEGKNSCGSAEEDLAEIRRQTEEAGFDFEYIMSEVKAQTTIRERAKIDREQIDLNMGSMPTDRLAARAWKREIAEQFGGAGDPDWARVNWAMKVDTRDRETQIADALAAVGRDNSTWHKRDLRLALTDIGVPMAEAKVIAHDYIRSSQTVIIGGLEDDPSQQFRVRIADEGLYASATTITKERELVAATRAALGARSALLTEEQFEEVLVRLEARGKVIDRDGDQYKMLRAALLGENGISLVAGQAGVGKSTTVEGVVEAIAILREEMIARGEFPPDVDLEGTRDSTVLSIVGCATSANAAEILEAESGMACYSVEMLWRRLESGAIQLAPGAVVVCDESSQLGTHNLRTIWEHVEAAGGRLVMTGDERQLQSPEAGGMFREIMDTIPQAVTYLSEIRRQVDIEERAVLSVLHDRGRLTKRSIEALQRQGIDQEFLDSLTHKNPMDGIAAVVDWRLAHGRVHQFMSPDQAMQALAEWYWDAAAEDGATGAEAAAWSNGDGAFVIARLNDDCDRLNAVIREEAMQRGILDPATSFEFGGKLWMLDELVVARKVRRNAKTSELDIKNGQSGLITGVETRAKSWTVELELPGGSKTTRTVYAEPSVGEMLSTEFDPGQVAKMRAYGVRNASHKASMVETAERNVARAEERLADLAANAKPRKNTIPQAEARLRAAQATLAERESGLKNARTYATWTRNLPDEGGAVDLPVLTEKVKAEHEVMTVLLGNGTVKHLDADYVREHVHTAFAATGDRAQGGTAKRGVEYGPASYVGQTRGKEWNASYGVINLDYLEIEDSKDENRAITRGWLEEVGGHEAVDAAFLSAFSSVSPGLGGSAVAVISPQVSIRGAIDEKQVRNDVAEAIAERRLAGEEVIGVSRTRAAAIAMSDQIIVEMARAEDLVPVEFGGHLWVEGMPVVIARGELNGGDHGATITVESVAWVPPAVGEEGAQLEMVVVDADGNHHALDQEAACQHLDTGLVVTAERARISGVEAEALVVVGAGLDEQDVEWLKSQAEELPVELAITEARVIGDGDLLAEPGVVVLNAEEIDAAVRGQLIEETRKEMYEQNASALFAIRVEEETRGMHSCRLEYQDAAEAVHRIEGLSAQEIAVQDVEKEMLRVSAQMEAAERARELADATEQDREDALAARLERKEQWDVLELRRRVLVGADVGDDVDVDLLLGEAIAESQDLHANDPYRLALAEKRLERFEDALVAHALDSPPEWAADIYVDPSLGEAERQREYATKLREVEVYRMRWEIKDDERDPLGPTPKKGRQVAEYLRLADLIEEPKRVRDLGVSI